MENRGLLMQEEIHESEDAANEEVFEESNEDSSLRRRKGKIISCAKETIENGELIQWLS